MRISRFLIPLLLFGSVTLFAQKRITLLFVGDLMQHQAQIDAARRSDGSYDYRHCFSAIQPVVAEADLAVANLEVTLAGKPYRGYPAFSAPDAFLHAVKECGFDILLTANNHCLDRGKRGFDRTLDMLDSLAIPRLGTYRDDTDRLRRYPMIIEKNGFRIVFLNYTYATNGLTETSPRIVNRIDRQTIRQDLATVRPLHPDAIIACMHWGTEYDLLPDESQKRLADWLLRQGVTHIIGSHPHVVQPMEVRTDSAGQKHIVAYSLGNFISNMSRTDTDGGAMLSLTLAKDSLGRACLSHCAYELVWTGRPLLTGHSDFRLYRISAPPDTLSPTVRRRMTQYAERTREHLGRHNIAVEENTGL